MIYIQLLPITINFDGDMAVTKMVNDLYELIAKLQNLNNSTFAPRNVEALLEIAR